MAICAYCKNDRPATREHVIPAFIYEFQKTIGGFIGWNEVVGKMVGGEAKVKDVCADCNNRVLGELDAYGKRLLVESGILTHNYLKRSVVLKFDHAKLLRWLLKISFNSSRTDGAHSYLFESLVPFIVEGVPIPHRSQVALVSYMAAPIAIDKSLGENALFYKPANGADTFNPFLARICYGFVPGGSNYVLRINIFGPLVFFMLIFPKGTLPGHAAVAIRNFLKVSPGAVELTHHMRLIELSAGPKTWLDLQEHQIQRALISGGA